MYAKTFFEEFDVDALTVAPYMGEDSVTPFLDYEGKWVILLALTSNKGSHDFQLTEDAQGERLFEKVMKTSQQWGTDENMMYVVGATQGQMFEDIRKVAPNHFLLVPGVGAQGGSLQEVCKYGKFIVSPGFNRSNVEYIQSIGVPVVPGTATPGEVEQAIELGLDCVKFFPAEQNGGIAKIKAMAAPYTKMHFMPTGGVNKNNLNDYLSFGKVFCCGGSWMVKKDLIAAGRFDEIEAMTRDAVNAMLGFTMKHVGINQESAEAAEATADKFDSLFGFTKKVGNSSVFAGSVVEVMKSAGRGTHGHIAIGTNNVDRAVYHLGRQGVKFDETSFSFDADNHLKVAYLADDFGGFAVHLVKN